MDQIILNGIQAMSCVGVPEGERAQPQKLEISVSLQVNAAEAASTDQLFRSVDYADVEKRVIETAAERPRHLIETLAEDIAQNLLRDFKTSRVEVQVSKFVLKNTRSVSVRITRP